MKNEKLKLEILKLLWAICICPFLYSAIPVTPVSAAFSATIETFPSGLKISDTGTITFSATLASATEYYVKVREVDTQNIETNGSDSTQWLGDKDAWSLFPLVASDDSGALNTKSILFRFKNSATTSSHSIVIRLAKKSSTTSQVDSNPVLVSVLAPDPTPTSTPTSTPTATATPTTTPTPTPTPTTDNSSDFGNITITEVYPVPEKGGNEWIEFYNNNDFEVNLKGWFIKDDNGNIREIDDLTIPGKEDVYKVFNPSFLNNTGGDKIYLLKKDKNTVVDSLPGRYPNLNSTQSWGKTGNVWCIMEPTKGDPNGSCADSKDKDSSEEEEDEEETSVKKSENVLTFEQESTDSATMMSRDLPLIAQSNFTPEASVAGVSTEKTSRLKPFVLPIIVMSMGLTMLGGAGVAVFKPEVLTKVTQLFTRK